jgi:hypothetical protein
MVSSVSLFFVIIPPVRHLSALFHRVLSGDDTALLDALFAEGVGPVLAGVQG